MIPSFHVDANGSAFASLQVITRREAYSVTFPSSLFHAARDCFQVELGQNIFSQAGCRLNIKNRDMELYGTLRYGPFYPLPYSIMGPFAHLPFMQCKHNIWSMMHRVEGTLYLNGTELDFQNGIGYIEGDRGSSFPRRYLWTQCNWSAQSLFLSIAEIPYLGIRFLGCIGVILFEGKQYRIATYRGVRLLHVSDQAVLLRQGSLSLEISRLNLEALPLRAPKQGSMTRMIHESAAGRVRYKCTLHGRILFDFISEHANFESEWND